MKPNDDTTKIENKMDNKKESDSPKLVCPMHRKRQKIRLPLTPRKSLKVYTCATCPAVFSRVTQLKYHAKMHLDVQREVHECDECHIVFPHLAKLVKHKRKHCRNFKCGECDAQFSQSSSFQLHMRVHSGERPYCCNECGATFIQSSHLNIHKRSHTGEKPYQCDVCKQAFKQISHLRTHERIHTQTKPFSCEQCGHSFIQKSSLNRHKRIHSGEKPYVCTLCQAAFCVKNNLDRHMIIHTGEQPYNCDLCAASFGQSVDLKRHRISHSGIKPFRCEQCEACFSRNNNLRWHKYTHTGETPLKCDQCSSQFMKPRDLKKHKMTHDPSNVHTCSVCNQNFDQVASFKKHMMTHTGQKPFTCEECLTTFSDKSSLKRHMLKHSNSKAFECKVCNSQFREARSLKKHTFQCHRKVDEKKSQPEVADEKTNQSENNIIALPQNNIYDPNNLVHQQYMTYQLQVQDPILQPTIPCNLYNGQDSTPQPALTYSTQAVGVSSIQPIVQTQTLMISGGPDQSLRGLRAVNNCQNHHAHVLTMTSNNQWQCLCFCESPNIPLPSLGITSIEEVPIPSDVTIDQGLSQAPQLQLQPEQSNPIESLTQHIVQSEGGGGALNHHPLILRSVNGLPQTVDAKLGSNFQFHLYTEGQVPSTPQPVWLNSNWIPQKLNQT